MKITNKKWVEDIQKNKKKQNKKTGKSEITHLPPEKDFQNENRERTPNDIGTPPCL